MSTVSLTETKIFCTAIVAVFQERRRIWRKHIGALLSCLVPQENHTCSTLAYKIVLCEIRIIRKWFEPRSSIPWLKKIIWVIGVLRRTVVSDWRFDNLCGSHLQSQVVVLVSWKFKNPGERFDWSIDRVAVGKYVMWLAVKTCAEIGYANKWIVKWIINKVLFFPVE